jgi:murein DD-endopeptidase MepM/ murein hydrolase activator NlpD
MSAAALQISLKLWLGRLAFRTRRHDFYHTHSKRPEAERQDLARKWHKRVLEAQWMVSKRRAQLAVSPPVAAPVNPILEHSWGWHPGVHDGVDLITEGDDVIYAICDATVIDVRSSGWWGKGARAAGGHSIADGDGIIQLRCEVDAGPFRKGLHFGYGHSEKATVKVGDRVKAGQMIGHAGFANAWHIHFMVNDGSTTRGVGDRDPWPFVDYAVRKGR